MTTQSATCGTASSDGSNGGITDWASLSNSQGATDTVYSTCSGIGGGDFTYRHIAQNFGFTIPVLSTINGITVTYRLRVSGGGSSDQEVLIIKGGTPGGTDHKSATAWPTTAADRTYGSSVDLWGLPWSVSDINSSNFGVSIAGTASGSSRTFSIDSVTIVVDYTGSAEGEEAVLSMTRCMISQP